MSCRCRSTSGQPLLRFHSTVMSKTTCQATNCSDHLPLKFAATRISLAGVIQAADANFQLTLHPKATAQIPLEIPVVRCCLEAVCHALLLGAQIASSRGLLRARDPRPADPKGSAAHGCQQELTEECLSLWLAVFTGLSHSLATDSNGDKGWGIAGQAILRRRR